MLLASPAPLFVFSWELRKIHGLDTRFDFQASGATDEEEALDPRLLHAADDGACAFDLLVVESGLLQPGSKALRTASWSATNRATSSSL